MISVPIRGTGVSWWSVQYSIETIRPTQKIPEADADRQRYRSLENGKKQENIDDNDCSYSSSKWLFGGFTNWCFHWILGKPPREESIILQTVERWPLCSDSTRYYGGWDTSKVFTHPFSLGFCLCICIFILIYINIYIYIFLYIYTYVCTA